MTVKELVSALNLEICALPAPDRTVTGVYVGDLLSWVMGRAEADCAWVTIMSNTNVLAVATLADVACVILAEGVVPDDQLIATANDKSINILLSKENSYLTCAALAALKI